VRDHTRHFCETGFPPLLDSKPWGGGPQKPTLFGHRGFFFSQAYLSSRGTEEKVVLAAPLALLLPPQTIMLDDDMLEKIGTRLVGLEAVGGRTSV
jgi:hypothetical protein